jgi:polar amino acid transport system substrate-binding protein
LDRIAKTGIVKVGYANERPFSYRHGAPGHITGESWEIAKLVLGRMGAQRIDGVQTEFWSLIPKLLNGTYDIIAAGFFITPIRYKEICFSYPTYRNQEGLIVKSGNPLHIRTYIEVIRHPFARIAVIFGSVASSHIRFHNIPPNRVVQYADGPSALKGIKAGEADIFIASSITLNDLIAQVGPSQLERVPEFDGFWANGQPVIDFGAFGFRKTDREFRDVFNQHLRPFIGSEEHLHMVAPFGFGPLELPGELPIPIVRMLD